jgi:hypothetical protein
MRYDIVLRGARCDVLGLLLRLPSAMLHARCTHTAAPDSLHAMPHARSPCVLCRRCTAAVSATSRHASAAAEGEQPTRCVQTVSAGGHSQEAHAVLCRAVPCYAVPAASASSAMAFGRVATDGRTSAGTFLPSGGFHAHLPPPSPCGDMR